VYGLSHTHLMRYLHRVPGEVMMGLLSSVLGMHGYARGLRATRHVAAPELTRTRRRVWSHRTRGGIGALVRRGRTGSLEARGDSGALSYWVTGLVPRGTWQHRSPLLAGGAHGASGHVVTPDPFPGGWCALCHGACGDTGALFWRVACSVP
jgi:hypothetical protein